MGFDSYAEKKSTTDEFAISFSEKETPTSLSSKEKKREFDKKKMETRELMKKLNIMLLLMKMFMTERLNKLVLYQ